MMLIPASPSRSSHQHGTLGEILHGHLAETSTTVAHVLVTVAIVSVVGCAEQLLRLLAAAGLWARWFVVFITTPARPAEAPVEVASTAPLVDPLLGSSASRRGPPVAVCVAATVTV
jgi:hypothetical protein